MKKSNPNPSSLNVKPLAAKSLAADSEKGQQLVPFTIAVGHLLPSNRA